MLPRPEPLAFGPDARPRFGWLHSPSTASGRSVGLVVCKPFGFEAICTHRTLRHLARAAAAAGIPAMRFDYDGTGDSYGTDRDAGRLSAWLSSIGDAVQTLRSRTGVEHVYLFGLRLGAALATVAAVERDDVAGVIAFAPVTSGRPWLRELSALEIAMRFEGPSDDKYKGDGQMESVGFVITDETKTALSAVDLFKLRAAPRRVLLIDRDDIPGAAKWAQHLSSTGSTLDVRAMPGYAQMMRDPHESIVPSHVIGAAVDWMVSNSVPATIRVSGGAPSVTFRGAEGVRETATYLGDSSLFGVVSMPEGIDTPKRAVVFLNSGAIPHVGPSRLYVDLARRWAARGYITFRFDQAGIGDSEPFDGHAENTVYASTALRGVEIALAFLKRSYSVEHTTSVGLCSGAYHSLKAAAAGLSVNAVVVVNPLVFYWKSGMSLAYPPYKVSAAAAGYRRAFWQPDKWKRLLSGKANLRAVIPVVSRRAFAHLKTQTRNVARFLRVPMKDDLGKELEHIATGGITISFIFATGDPGEDLLRSEAGYSVGRLSRRKLLHISRIRGPDHSFTQVWTRAALTDTLERELSIS